MKRFVRRNQKRKKRAFHKAAKRKVWMNQVCEHCQRSRREHAVRTVPPSTNKIYKCLFEGTEFKLYVQKRAPSMWFQYSEDAGGAF